MIVLQGVTKRFSREIVALDDFSLTIRNEEFVFLVGPNGAGKTTLLRLLIRAEAPTDGVVEIDGVDVAQLPERQVPMLRRRFGIVFQEPRLLPDRDVYENVAFTLRVTGHDRASIGLLVPAALALVGLQGQARRRPQELSGGEQQKVAIARAIVHRPSILIADEPTGNLSPSSALQVMRVLESVNLMGVTTIVATHDRAVVNSMRKRVVLIDRGRLAYDARESGYPGAACSCDCAAHQERPRLATLSA